MTKKKEKLDVVFILDKSGSMYGMENDTIGGYNHYIEYFKNKDANITTVLFNNEYEMICKRQKVSEVKELTKKEYFVNGCTALLDTIGSSIKFMEDEKAEKVIFIITTDGYENASRKYNKEQIKEMISAHKEWEFIYIGADIDSYSEGESIGIKASNIANYQKDKKGVSNMFKAASLASELFLEKDCINPTWKKDLESHPTEKTK